MQFTHPRMISLKTHNIVDYCLGAAFILAPHLFDFSRVYFAHDVFLVLGLAILGYSALTDYRYSLVKAIPVNMHLTFDIAVGIFAVLAPWIYGYRDELSSLQIDVHWAFGMSAIAIAVMTGWEKKRPMMILLPEDQDRSEKRRSTKQAA